MAGAVRAQGGGLEVSRQLAETRGQVGRLRVDEQKGAALRPLGFKVDKKSEQQAVVERSWVYVAAASFAFLLALGPTAAWAQAGWYVTSTLHLTGEFDDNISGSSSNRQADWISRLSDNAVFGYRSAPLTLLANTELNVEAFASHPERDGVNRAALGLDFTYRPDRPVTFRLGAAFIQTQTPSDVTPGLGLELGRHETHQVTASPSLTYRFSQRTSGEVTYAYSQSESVGVTNTTGETRLGLSHQLTRVDSGRIGYALMLTDSGGESLRSDVLTLGWTRQLSATTQLMLSGGSRMTDGKLGVEAAGTLDHRFRQGQVTLAYSRTETPIVGQAGLATAQSLSGTLALEPLKSLRVTFVPMVSRVSQGPTDTTTLALDLSASYRLLKWLSASFHYHFGRSETSATSGGSATPGTTIDHNIVSVSLDVSYPFRVE
jgi:hypothetical protein